MHIVKFDGKQLKALRVSRKWDQHRLAEAARAFPSGITQSQISRYENGQEPSGRNALALAAALGVEVRDLYSDDDDTEDRVALVAFPHRDVMEALYLSLGIALGKAEFAADRKTEVAA